MLLPQSAAFAALKNRLNSVSAIGYLHVPQHGPAARSSVGTVAPTGPTPATTPTATNFDRAPPRLKTKDEGQVRWTDLLGRFKEAQEKGRRASRVGASSEDEPPSVFGAPPDGAGHGVTEPRRLLGPMREDQLHRSNTSPAVGPGLVGKGGVRGDSPGMKEEKEKKSRFSAGRFGKVVGGGKKK